MWFKNLGKVLAAVVCRLVFVGCWRVLKGVEGCWGCWRVLEGVGGAYKSLEYSIDKENRTFLSI